MSQIGKRYDLLEHLGMGGMGMVYRAFDRLTGQYVALKQVTHAPESWGSSPSRAADLQMALAREFKVLSSLRHPNIISVLDYGFDTDGLPYYTMDLLENPVTILEAADDHSLAHQVGLLIQTLQALAYLHRWRILHRDLKPENVLVVDGQVKVLDFGLAMPLDQAAQDDVTGTLAYLAPEILLGEPSSPAADLYAVGVIAYELFGGRYLYDDTGVTSLVNEILSAVPDIDVLNVEPSLRAVIARLLVKSPAERYQNAVEVIHALSAAIDQPMMAETSAIRESFLQAARFVGRDDELRQLSTAQDQAVESRGSIWLIGGESGVGKSRLLEEVGNLALVKGMLVARGQAIREGGGIYNLWRDVLRRIILMTDVSDAEAGVLKSFVPDISDLLNHPIAGVPDVEPALVQARLVGVVSILLRRIDQPLLIILEDLQWAGTESLSLLGLLSSAVKDQPILIIGSYRDDEAFTLPEQLTTFHLMTLARLRYEDVTALSESMLGNQGTQPYLVEMLHHETEGNVFFLVETVRALAEEAGDLEHIGSLTLPSRVFSGGIEAIVQRRLQRISERWLPALKLASVIGRYLDFRLMEALDSGLDWEKFLIAGASAAVLDVQEDRWRFSHDKLREGILRQLDEHERTALHQRVAMTIEAVYPDHPDHYRALAHHWYQAGSIEKSVRYSALAGDVQLNASAYIEAIASFKQALSLLQGDDRAIKAQQALFMRSTASALWGIGRYQEANQYFKDSMALYQEVDDKAGMAEAVKGLGDVARRTGDYAQAQQYFETCLNLSLESDASVALAQALARVGLIARILGDFEKAERYYLESLTIYETLKMRSQIVTLYSGLGLIVSDMGRLEEAQDYIERSLEIARELHNPSGTALILTGLAWVHYLAGHYEDAQRYSLESLSITRDIGDRWSIANNLGNLGKIAFRLKDTYAAQTYFKEALSIAKDIEVIPLILEILPGVAEVYLGTAKPELAVTLLHLALHHDYSYSEVELQARPLLEQLQKELDHQRFQEAVGQAKQLSLEAVLNMIIFDGKDFEKNGEFV
ncbi:MAG: tetratricopeptide repeat protein [Anaerolineae bacterium]|nr:tetratricopeptide repeat protein [Anaerolineae bacterium]